MAMSKATPLLDGVRVLRFAGPAKSSLHAILFSNGIRCLMFDRKLLCAEAVRLKAALSEDTFNRRCADDKLCVVDSGGESARENV